MTQVLLLLLSCGIVCGFDIIATTHPTLVRRRAPAVVAVSSWYDSGIRLDASAGSIDIYAAPSPAAPPTAPPRETANEAWAKAPEGSFLSPALLAGIFALGLSIRFVIFGPDGPKFF